ncbi:MAG: 2-oxoacid:acceptor oxidoreductase subunit alpha [Myxococcota bacterium]
MDTSVSSQPPAEPSSRESLDAVVIRFAGDSGDGMQLTGDQFTLATALAGNDLATFPDYPAEIRAPAGTTYGVSGFQIHFASSDIMTPGDQPDVLVAMNPAALKVNLADLKRGGLVILNTGAFTKQNVAKAGYVGNPLEDGTLDPYRKLELDIQSLTLAAVKDFGLSAKEAQRTKNMWTLGLVLWLFGRDKQTTIDWLKTKFAKHPEVADANIAALNAGFNFGETAEMPSGIGVYQVPKAELSPGLYRNISGNQALAWGLVAAAKLSGLEVVYGSYPITPASSLLHSLAPLKHFGVTTFQAEDEIAAVCAAIGASYGGAIGVTATSGPGLALKSEAVGLAVMTELPLVVLNIQRGGPSTGLPTKTEQSDLLQAMYGRNGDAPVCVLAPATPGDCFEMAVEAVRIATQHMTPVILLSDGYLANGAEPWRIPDVEAMKPFPPKMRTEGGEGFHPYLRDPETLVRSWAVPGTPGLEHRIGGLEKGYDSGNISYDPDNHHKMTEVRAEKIRRIADDLPEADVDLGDRTGDLVVVGWGSTYGATNQAVRQVRAEGRSVSHIHLRHLNPLPRKLGELLAGFDKVLVPEINNGQLVKVLRAEFLAPAVGHNRITGKPFRVAELADRIRVELGARAREEAAE